MKTLKKLIRTYRFHVTERKTRKGWDLLHLMSNNSISFSFDGNSCSVDKNMMDTPEYRILEEVLDVN